MNTIECMSLLCFFRFNHRRRHFMRLTIKKVVRQTSLLIHNYCLDSFFLTGPTSAASITDDLYDIKLENVVHSKPLDNYDPTTQLLKAIPSATVSAMLAKGAIKPTTWVYRYGDETYESVEKFIQPSQFKKLDLWIIFCGALAVSAMLLPGISGTYLLTILGMYAVVIGALADFTGGLMHGHFDMHAFTILANMLIGILIGAILATRFVSWILAHYHDWAIAGLTGFMVGALRSVWPFWNYRYVPLPLHIEKGPQLEALNPIMPSLFTQGTWIAICLAILGAALILSLHYFVQKKTKTSVVSIANFVQK